MDPQELRELARAGAMTRLNTLDAERNRIFGEFPDLAPAGHEARRLKTSTGQPVTVAHDRPARATKRRLSATQRRNISQRMKAYWATKRAQGK